MSLLSRRILYPSLSAKPEIIYGKGSLGALRNLPGDNFLVLSSNSFSKSESYTKLHEKLLASKKFDLEIIQNSFDKQITNIVEKYKSWPPDLVIAIGGGSVLDSAKLIRHFLSFPEENFDNLAKKITNLPPKVKLVSIPTTPNTASEVNNIAVVKKAEGEKTPFINKTFTPDLAILDPVLLSTISDNLMNDFVSDIFAHAFEGSRSRLSNKLLKNLATTAVSALSENLTRFKDDKTDLEAIENIQFIGQQAGIVAENAFVGIMHALAHALETITNSTHGHCLHSLLPPMLEWINSHEPEHSFNYNFFTEIWNTLDLSSTADKTLLKQVNWDEWVKLTLTDPSIKTDPIKFKEEEVKELISWLQATN